MRIVGCSTCRRERPVSGFGRCLVCGEVVAETRLWYWAPILSWGLRGIAPTALLVCAWLGLSQFDALWFNAEGLRELTGEHGDLVLGFMAFSSLALFLAACRR